MQPGRREARYAHLLGGEPAVDDAAAAATPAAVELAAAPKTDRVAGLERRLEAIAELKALRAEFDAFKAQLGA
ncbi:MAG: hypothetical protein U1F87_02685 [Kiritimatiellia bacterium]